MSLLKMLFIALLVSASIMAQAQNQPLIAKKNDAGLYIDHTVQPKEGIYAIGRLYNVHPKSIAGFNKIDINKGLNIGEIIKVPLEAGNFSQTSTSGIPVYYIVGEKDGLMKVSNFANKLTLQKIRDWNQLSSDNLNVGQNLVVGYLQSAELAKVTPKQNVPVTPPAAVKPKDETHPVETVKAEVTPPVKTEAVVVKETPKTEDPRPAVIKETVTPAATPTVVNTPLTGDGYFAASFAAQIKQTAADNNETVTSGIFKTSSGWQDAKYYLLMDKVQAGKIVRITNPNNNKTVYAKVLGEMSSIKQNQGLNIRISNAAAAALGISESDKFIVNVNY